MGRASSARLRQGSQLSHGGEVQIPTTIISIHKAQLDQIFENSDNVVWHRLLTDESLEKKAEKESP